MKNNNMGAETQGAEAPKKDPRYQFTVSEIKEMLEDKELLTTVEQLAADETNKGKAGSYLLTIAKAIRKQLTSI